MSEQQFKRGDRVRHEKRTDWGLGEVLDDQHGDRVRIIFEDEGLKTFQLGIANFLNVSGEEAQSEYLTALVKHANKPASKAGSMSAVSHLTFSEAVKVFLSHFPQGFQDPNYLSGPKSERDFKLRARDLLLELLPQDKLHALLDAGKYDEIFERAKSIINKTSLIHHYEKFWLSESLSSPMRRQLFAKELAYLLSVELPVRDRFERFTKMLYDVGAAKWTIATYFLFLASPDDQIFVKPEATKRAARTLHAEIGFRSEVNWTTYSRILRMAEALRQKLSDEGKAQLKPVDMIDVQSFIWVMGPAYSA